MKLQPEEMTNEWAEAIYEKAEKAEKEMTQVRAQARVTYRECDRHYAAGTDVCCELVEKWMEEKA